MFQSIVSTLLGVIAPLSVPVLIGAALARWKGFESKQLLTIVLYVLSPAIIFQTLTTAQVSRADVAQSLAFAFANFLLMWGAAKAIGKFGRLPAEETAGLTLMATITNCVNYGLPLVFLAFGQLGLDKASVFVVMQMIMVNTVGIYIAARSRFSVKMAVKAVFSLPSIYAMAAALFLRGTGLALPEGIAKGFSMIAQAYSPVVLIALGAQMLSVKSAKLSAASLRTFWAGMALRMLASPLIAWGLLTLLGIEGILKAVLIVEASMPVAINSVILAERFDAAPKTVSTGILWSTLISFATLPVLIALVKG